MKYHKMVMLSVCCSQAESTEEARSKRRRLEAWAEGSPMVLMVAGARLHVDPKQHLGSIGGFFRGTGGMTPHCWHYQAYRRKDVDRQPKLCRNYVSFGEPSLQAAFRPRKWKRTEKEMKRKWKKQNRTKQIYCFSFPFFPICFYSSLWFWQVTGWRTAISFSCCNGWPVALARLPSAGRAPALWVVLWAIFGSKAEDMLSLWRFI